MNHALLAGSVLHEAAELLDAGDLTGVDLADLGLEDDGGDGGLASLGLSGVDSGDADGTVVVDVHLGTGLGLDLLDHGAALTDDLADLVGIDLHDGHLGSELGNGLAGLRNGLQNDLVDDVVTACVGLLQSLLDDLGGQTVDLQIHLDGGDTLVSTGHLEVHVAVEVLKTLDVDHGIPRAVLGGDQTAGDTGDGSGDRHTGVHQSQGRAADRALGGRAVGGDHVRDQTDGVGELLGGGQHGDQGTLGQSAVTDLAAAGRTGGLSLTGGEAGHVVVVHVALLGLVVDTVQHLSLGQSTQSGNGQHLGLATGEETRAVGAGQNADLGAQGTDGVHGTAVHALLVHQQPAADDLLLDLVDQLLHDGRDLGVLGLELSDDGILNGNHAGVADVLIIGVQSGHDVLLAEGEDLVEHIVIQIAGGVLELGLADVSDDGVDEDQQLLDLGVSLHDGLEHGVVVHFLGACLDHDHLLHGSGHGQLQIAHLALSLGGVDHDLTVHETHEHAADGAVPRNVGDGEGDGSTDHSGDLGGAVVIHGHDGEGQSHVVAQILGEQGTDGTVDDAGGQNGLLGGLTLALQITAGDLTGSVHSLVEVHGQGQEVDAVAGLLGSGGAAENGGVAVAAEAGAVGQAGKLTGLDDQGTACQGVLVDLVVLKLHSGALDGVHFFFLHLQILFFVMIVASLICGV